MKTTVTQMIYGLSLSLPLTLTSVANAKTTTDLTLDCHGEYQVVSATPYFQDFPKHPTRAPQIAHAGANEIVKVVSLEGADCEKLKTYYGVDLYVGQSVPMTVSTLPATKSQAEIFANEEIGKKYPIEISQDFLYTDDKNLPLFPYVHAEYVQVLSLHGQANSKALYGTPTFGDLSDAVKQKIAKYIFEKKTWGKVYSEYYGSSADNDNWTMLLGKLSFKDEDLALQYVQDLALMFNNATKNYGTIYPYSAVAEIGKVLSVNLNKYGKSKWSTKLNIVKQNPALLSTFVLPWSNKEEVVQLTAIEVEEYLTYTLDQIKLLKQVTQLVQASILAGQYQKSAQALLSKSIDNKPLFELTPKSLELIETIKAL